MLGITRRDGKMATRHSENTKFKDSQTTIMREWSTCVGLVILILTDSSWTIRGVTEWQSVHGRSRQAR